VDDSFDKNRPLEIPESQKNSQKILITEKPSRRHKKNGASEIRIIGKSMGSKIRDYVENCYIFA